MTRAVILLSGGLDSATVLAIARSEGRECHALSTVYGQRHIVELEAARRVAAAMGVDEHVVHSLDLRVFGASALTGEIEVPKEIGRASCRKVVIEVDARRLKKVARDRQTGFNEV